MNDAAHAALDALVAARSERAWFVAKFASLCSALQAVDAFTSFVD